jgi:hypothetical protein
VDARVADASRSEKKLHDSSSVMITIAVRLVFINGFFFFWFLAYLDTVVRTAGLQTLESG